MKDKNGKEVEHKVYMPFIRLAKGNRLLHVVSETEQYSSEQMRIQYKNVFKKAHLCIKKNDETRARPVVAHKKLTNLVNRINYTKLCLDKEDPHANYE